MGTVLVTFSFFWTDNACCPPLACPLAQPDVKILIYIVEKHETYVEFDFSMGTVVVIFSFFWTDNDLVCAPPPLRAPSGGIPIPQLCTNFGAYLKNYSHDFPETLGSCSKQYKGN